jgi:hypothetical protein
MKKAQVRWPSGLNQEFVELSADAIYEIKEGQPVKKEAAMAIP